MPLGRTMEITVEGPSGVGKSQFLALMMQRMNDKYEFIASETSEHSVLVVRKENLDASNVDRD